jgi:hypothetical protein
MKLLDWIGDRNPQLLREWQGRTQPWNVMGALALSIVGQLIFLSNRYSSLPAVYSDSHLYCTGEQIDSVRSWGSALPFSKCIKDGVGGSLINWSPWWRDNFGYLTQCLIVGLVIAGVYLLISNLVYEERRGTLNFVRLSPRSNRELLLGKLLGVPVLLFLALAIALPLHLWSAVQGNISLGIVLGVYLMGAMSCFFFYSGAVLWSLTTSALGNFQPWVGAGFAAVTIGGLVSFTPYGLQSPFAWIGAFSPTLILNYVTHTPGYSTRGGWFNLPLYDHGISVTLVSLLYLAVWSYWVWQAIDRRFRNPNATTLSKTQSYYFTTCLIVSLIGFGWGDAADSSMQGYLFLSFVMALVVMMLITPNRQTLQEWARYRHNLPRQEQGLWSDLLWGEKSPALLAVAVNLAIVTVFLYGLFQRLAVKFYDESQLSFAPLLMAGTILTLAAVFQVMLMGRSPKAALWAVSTLGVLLVFPAIVAAAFARVNSAVWLLTAFPWLASESVVPVTTILMGLFGQLSIFMMLVYRLNRQLDRAGASASKALLGGVKV